VAAPAAHFHGAVAVTEVGPRGKLDFRMGAALATTLPVRLVTSKLGPTDPTFCTNIPVYPNSS